MSDRSRASEAERRETAFAHRGEVEEGSGEKLTPKHVSQMVSVRLDGELAGALRDVAERRGMTVSDVLREAVADIVLAESSSDVPQVIYFEVKTSAKEHSFRSSDYATGAWSLRATDRDDDQLGVAPT